ncbi:MAG: hypothetical protein LRY40_02085, partial [Shewanella fodinae]|nr:hypothetical protein [Shewanella fodinae]
AALVLLQTSCSQQAPAEVTATEGKATVQISAYGTWTSPLTAEDVFGQAVTIGQLQSVDGAIYFSESDPKQGGQLGIKKLAADDQVTEVVPAAFGVGSRVHEYGGGALSGHRQQYFRYPHGGSAVLSDCA